MDKEEDSRHDPMDNSAIPLQKADFPSLLGKERVIPTRGKERETCLGGNPADGGTVPFIWLALDPAN
jgi:hypothetical protein